MTVFLALVCLAVLTALLAPRLLVGATWTRRAPRLGILAWQACVFAVLASCVLLALSAFWPVERVSLDLGHIVHACPEAVQRHYELPLDASVHVVGLGVAAVTLLALGAATVRCGLSVRRGRQCQRELLDLLVRERDDLSGAHILDHEVPLAYCVPGAGGGRVVLTTAAVAALDERQVTAVLAHEHAHLDGHHDLVLFGADVASLAFPWSRFFRAARRELATLIEMVADDESVRRSDRDSLASALVDLGQETAPPGAVAANGDTVARVHRLISAEPAPPLSRRVLVVAGSITLGLSPWLIAVVPVLAARAGLCTA